MNIKTFTQPRSMVAVATGIACLSSVNSAWASGLGIEGYGVIWAFILVYICIPTGVAFLSFYIVARLCRRNGVDSTSESKDTKFGWRFMVPLCCALLSAACIWWIIENNIKRGSDINYKIAEIYKESKMIEEFGRKEYSSMSADKLSDLGQALVQNKEFKQALAAFLVGLEKDKHNKVLLNEISDAYARLEAYPLSEKYAREALKLDPTYAKAHSNLGKALVCLYKEEEGLAHEQQALTYGDNSADVYFYIGLAHERLARNQEARKAYEQVRKFAPDYPDLQKRLSIVTENR